MYDAHKLTYFYMYDVDVDLCMHALASESPSSRAVTDSGTIDIVNSQCLYYYFPDDVFCTVGIGICILVWWLVAVAGGTPCMYMYM